MSRDFDHAQHSREIYGVWNSQKAYVTLATPLSGMVGCSKANTWNSLQAHEFQPSQRYFSGCEILQCVTWPWPRELRGQLVIWRSVLPVAKPCTKFEVCSFNRPEDISWGV